MANDKFLEEIEKIIKDFVKKIGNSDGEGTALNGNIFSSENGSHIFWYSPKYNDYSGNQINIISEEFIKLIRSKMNKYGVGGLNIGPESQGASSCYPMRISITTVKITDKKE